MRGKNRFASLFLALLLFIGGITLVKADASGIDQNSLFHIGCGIYDITGPTAEIVTMGYGDIGLQTQGLHTRLRSRAFIIKASNSDKRVVFVSADLGQLFQAVKQGVVKKLKSSYGNLYDDTNVMISATHTHSGPGGYSHYALYNLSCKGFIQQNYDCIVEGIYQSIVRAHNNIEPGYIYMKTGKVEGTSVNRSLEAFKKNSELAGNPAAYINQYDEVDKLMTVLKFVNTSEQPLGMLSWFAVHNTSMGNDNNLVSADNKGYAAYLFEKSMETDYSSKKTFVAAFAQSNCGDVSPNIYGGENGWGSNDFESTWYAGKKQYDVAKQLYDTAEVRLSNTIEYQHQYVDFSNEPIAPEYAEGQNGKRTYPAAIGVSFAGGAEDGPSSLYPTIHEGMTQDNSSLSDVMKKLSSWYELITIGNSDTELWKQHYPKPILSATGLFNPPWTPEVLPVQIFKLGQVSILGAPAEMTTMAGRRLRNKVVETLDQGASGNHIVIAGLSNAYAGYVATREEYNEQHYEGASTHFGPWTLNAFIQNFDELAKAIVDGTTAAAGPTPRDLSSSQTSVQTGVWHDGVPVGKSFGDINTDAKDYYISGETVKVKYWSGHPKNNLKIQSTYLEVQRYDNGSWSTVLRDWDWDTKFRWERVDPIWGTSLSTVEWNIASDTASGLYRIKHYGSYKEAVTGNIKEYSGTSKVFNVKADGAQEYIGNAEAIISTSSDWWSGTNDDIYLGLKYSDGSKSEFNLDHEWYDDFEPGDTCTYNIFSYKKQGEVKEIYLRKSGIDGWKVKSLKIKIGGETKLDKSINTWINTSSDIWKTSVSW